MKRSLLMVACFGIATFSGLLQSMAQSLPPGLYIKANAGGNLTEDTKMGEFFGPVAPGTKVKFDPGANVDFGVGYELCEWFAVEGQLGVLANNISSISGADRVDAVFSNVPFLINGRIQLPKRRFCISPYIGGGFGVSAAVLDTDRIELNDTRLHGTDTDAVFAYQAFAGLRYNLNDTMGISVEYRFFGTTNPSWRADHTFGTASDRMSFGDIHTHSLSVAFDFTF